MTWIIRETIWTVIKSRRISAGGLIEIQSQFLSSDSLISKPFRYLVPSGPTWRAIESIHAFGLSCFPQIYPQIYFLSTSLYPLEDFSWQPDNETIVRFETIPTFTQGKVITERCVLIFFVKKKKRKRKEKDRKFLRVEETLEKKESRNLSFKALKSHLPMVASDVKQSTLLSLSFSVPFSLFSVLFSFSNQSSLSPPPATCWRKEDL